MHVGQKAVKMKTERLFIVKQESLLSNMFSLRKKSVHFVERLSFSSHSKVAGDF